jgi:GNAT superfamily N-acetyltransferase
MSDIVDQNAKVALVRQHLDHVPNWCLPGGYRLRWHAPGDVESWWRIWREAENVTELRDDAFELAFGSAPEELPRRQLFALAPDGQPVGTATAWFSHYYGRPFGQVHWVGVLPAHQGRGIARALLSRVCARLRELGHDKAFLYTSTARVRAIRLYLGFGFVPAIRSAEDLEVWQALAPVLNTAASRETRFGLARPSGGML